MQPSSELRDLVIRYWEVFAGGDVSFVEAHIPADRVVSGIGTDPDEGYEGAGVHHVLTARSTAVAHREDGEWKLVRANTSVGVPDQQLVGQTLPA